MYDDDNYGVFFSDNRRKNISFQFTYAECKYFVMCAYGYFICTITIRTTSQIYREETYKYKNKMYSWIDGLGCFERNNEIL